MKSKFQALDLKTIPSEDGSLRPALLEAVIFSSVGATTLFVL
jgi:hypothetical protein